MEQHEIEDLKFLLKKYHKEKKGEGFALPRDKVEEECAEVILADLGDGNIVDEKGDLFGCLLDLMHERPHYFFQWMRRMRARGRYWMPSQEKYIRMYKYGI